jgi:hypothetical protein
MKNISIGLVCALIAQSVLADKSGGVQVLNPAAAPIVLMGKIASDLMWSAPKGGSTAARKSGGNNKAKAEPGAGSPKSHNNALSPNRGASSAGSGAGNGGGGQPPSNPGNQTSVNDNVKNKTLAELLELLEQLLIQMRAQGLTSDQAQALLARVNTVADAYVNARLVYWFGWMGDGRGRVNALRQEAQQIVQRLIPAPVGRLTELAGRVDETERRLAQQEDVLQARIMRDAASSAQQNRRAVDDIIPDELDNNGEEI